MRNFLSSLARGLPFEERVHNQAAPQRGSGFSERRRKPPASVEWSRLVSGRVTMECVLESHVTCASRWNSRSSKSNRKRPVVPEKETRIDTCESRRQETCAGLLQPAPRGRARARVLGRLRAPETRRPRHATTAIAAAFFVNFFEKFMKKQIFGFFNLIFNLKNKNKCKNRFRLLSLSLVRPALSRRLSSATEHGRRQHIQNPTELERNTRVFKNRQHIQPRARPARADAPKPRAVVSRYCEYVPNENDLASLAL